MQTKPPPIFFQLVLGVSSKFLQKAFVSRTLNYFCDFNFDILLTVFDLFHFLLGGYLIKRGVVY